MSNIAIYMENCELTEKNGSCFLHALYFFLVRNIKKNYISTGMAFNFLTQDRDLGPNIPNKYL